jgi:glycosyltransferase involved in cell wall biosynthesis
MNSFAKRPTISKDDILELCEQMKNIRQIGFFYFNEASKNNLMYALIKAIYERDEVLALRIYQDYFLTVFDARSERFMVVMNNRKRNLHATSNILKFFPHDQWKIDRQKDLTTRMRKTSQYQDAAPVGWQPNFHSSLLNKHGNRFTHLLSDKGNGNRLTIVGRTTTIGSTDYNAALCHFQFRDNKSLLINISPELAVEMGLSHSRAVGPYSYLKCDKYGFFIIDFNLPEECESVDFSFRTWSASDDIITLDPRIYVVDVENDGWFNTMNTLAQRIGKWYELEEWSSMVSRFFEAQMVHQLKTRNIEELRTEITSFKVDADIQVEIIETLLFIIDAHEIVHEHHFDQNLMLELLNALLERKPENATSIQLLRLLISQRTYTKSRNIALFALELVQDELGKMQPLKSPELVIIESRIQSILGNLTKAILVMEEHQIYFANHPSYNRRLGFFKQHLSMLEEGFTVKNLNCSKYVPDGGVIYLLHNSLPHHNGGYACRSHGLLTALLDLGVDIQPLTRHCYPWDLSDFREHELVDHEIVDSVKYHRTFNSSETNSSTGPYDNIYNYASRVIQHAQLNKSSIIHAASNHRNGLAAVIAARNLGIPCIYEVRGFWEITRISREPEWLHSEQYQLAESMETTACQLSDQVITLNNAMKQELIRRGIDENKIVIIPNGVDCERFQPMDKDVKLLDELGLKDRFIIGYIGSLVGYEGLDVLIQAMNLICFDNPDLHVLIVGDGVEMESLQQMVKNHYLEEKFTFTGRVPHEKVERYHSIVDIAVFPRVSTPVTELVTPLKPFEAMAMAKCIICSNVKALSEFIIEGKNGLTFIKDDPQSLAEILIHARTSGDYYTIGQEARNWVKMNRDWNIICSRLKDIYERLTIKKTEMIERFIMDSTHLNIKKIASFNHSDSLVVYFHGAVNRKNNSPPIYYHHKLPYDVISISDTNLEANSELTAGWHSNGPDFKVNDAINCYIQKMKSQYENIICVGSSSGGFVALRTAIQSEVMATAYNCQVDIKKYGEKAIIARKRFIEYFNGTALECLEELFLNNTLSESSTLQPILISQNKRDIHHYQQHFLPFKELVDELEVKHIDFNEFDEGDNVPHQIRSKGNELMAVTILKDIQFLISKKQKNG